jgi:hypothetical protein
LETALKRLHDHTGHVSFDATTNPTNNAIYIVRRYLPMPFLDLLVSTLVELAPRLEIDLVGEFPLGTPYYVRTIRRRPRRRRRATLKKKMKKKKVNGLSMKPSPHRPVSHATAIKQPRRMRNPLTKPSVHHIASFTPETFAGSCIRSCVRRDRGSYLLPHSHRLLTVQLSYVASDGG